MPPDRDPEGRQHEGQAGQRDQPGTEPDRAEPPGLRLGHPAAARRAELDLGPSQQAPRPHHQHHRHHHEDEHDGDLRQQQHAIGVEHPDEQRGEQRAPDRAHAPDHHHHERLHDDRRIHHGGEREPRHLERAAQAGQEGAQDEHGREQP
jgi:hypothetical protein